MPTFADITNRQKALIRKGLDGAVFIKAYDAADEAIAAITDATGLLELPTGYEDVGAITKDDGATWTREAETSDSTSWGFSEPTRRDIIGDVTGLQFTAQESNKRTLEMYSGVDLSGVTFDATTGEITWDKPDIPESRFFRVLAIGKDGDGADALYFARWLPRAQVTDLGDQVWQVGTELQYPLTLTAFNDDTVGTAVREFWAGPAMLGGLAAAMGFESSGA